MKNYPCPTTAPVFVPIDVMQIHDAHFTLKFINIRLIEIVYTGCIINPYPVI